LSCYISEDLPENSTVLISTDFSLAEIQVSSWSTKLQPIPGWRTAEPLVDKRQTKTLRDGVPFPLPSNPSIHPRQAFLEEMKENIT